VVIQCLEDRGDTRKEYEKKSHPTTATLGEWDIPGQASRGKDYRRKKHKGTGGSDKRGGGVRNKEGYTLP